MKIILSPSKTANWTKVDYLEDKELSYPTKTTTLFQKITALSKAQLKTALSLSDSLMNPTYDLYHDADNRDLFHAFPSFNGLVFKQLNKETYQAQEWDYIAKHVRILDALYGVLEPGTCIRPYRLDMKAKLGLNLYDFWTITPDFKDEQIINLASNEFSSMLSLEMIDIVFYQCQSGTCKTQATYSKMGRGKMLDYMITNHVTTIDQIKAFHADGYQYDATRSSANKIAFSRST
jgi:cytoplasmic iron level regulating protein YaaA (DUF328/UPF0246 family)